MGTVLTAIERAGLPKRMAYSDFAAAPAMISGGAVHLGGNPWQHLHQEVSSSHPGLDRTEGMHNFRRAGDRCGRSLTPRSLSLATMPPILSE
jgi:hypothetical protein